MYLGTGKNTALNYFLPLSDPSENNISLVEVCSPQDDDIEMQEDVPEQVVGQDEDKEQEDQHEHVARVNTKLDEVIEKMKEMYAGRIAEDVKGYEKALNTLSNHLDKMPKTNDAVLQKAACTFGEIVTAPLRAQKRKKSSVIPVQVKAKFALFFIK